MGFHTFAAIDIGSYELSMKIFEISSERGIKEIDHIRHRIELGSDSYFTGKITNERIDELCRILREFTQIMESYKVDDYTAYGTSAIRETQNTLILLDQIEMRTGIHIDVLGNSAQRFLDYKSVASKGQDFQDIIEKSTAFIDIGGGSIQMSLFDHDSLITTQNFRPGVLRLREEMNRISFRSYQMEEIVDEFVSDKLSSFREMFAGNREIENIILVDDYVSLIIQKGLLPTNREGHILAQDFISFVDEMRDKKTEELVKTLGLAEENISLLYLSAIMTKYMVTIFGANMLWAPGVCLCDGMAYEYAENHQLLEQSHNFEQDILACARNLNKRYLGSEKRTRERENHSLVIFDGLKKIHGLSQRDRLLLQLSAILCDCGRYISLTNVGESSYNIVMATEMIGLSHLERMIVAYIVKYVTEPFEYYETLGTVTTLSKESYLKIAKLTAILRLADGLDVSHKEKCNQIKVTLKESEVMIDVESNVDMTLEIGMFGRSADFFEEVFNIKPIVKQYRTNI